MWKFLGVCVGAVLIAVVVVGGLYLLPVPSPAITLPAPMLTVRSPYQVHCSCNGVNVDLIDVVSPSPGGAVTPDTSTPEGSAGVTVEQGVESLAPVAFAFLGSLLGVIVIWWAVRYVGRSVAGR